VTTRTVTAWVPAACAVDGGGFAEYYPYGDFEPPPHQQTAEYLSASGVELTGIAASTRALVVKVSESGQSWTGVGAVPDTGDVSVLVTRTFASCPLSGSVGPRTGATLAPIGGARVMLAGGDPGPGNPTPTTYVARLDTGEVAAVTAELPTPRTGASVTAFGDGAIVAGGTSIDDGLVLDRVDFYDAATGGFDQANPLHLDTPRSGHGAVVLASGKTLLVGGVSTDKASALDSLETLDPVTHEITEGGLGRLRTARVSPTVLRLATGAILVAGGFDVAGNPVQTLEWFAADGSPDPARQPLTLAQGGARAFFALAGGSALAVVTPPAGTPDCPVAPTCFQNVWVIDATGAPEAATRVAGTLTDPALFGGADGAPALWTGDRWLRWQPYAAAFGALDVLDDVPAHVGLTRASPDLGLAMWLDDGPGALTLLRFDTGDAYATLLGPLLVTSPDATSPDRLAAVQWDPATGLVLGSGTPGAAAFVADRTYADVSVDVDAPTGEPAMVVLRDEGGVELDVGGADCPGALQPGAPSTLHVERRGQAVAWAIGGPGGSPSGSCTTSSDAGARMSVGVRAAGSTRSVAHNLVVTRLGVP
jgi:hypothetical protein